MTSQWHVGVVPPSSRRARWWAVLIAAGLLAGCGVSVRVEPLSGHRYPERPKGFVVEALDAEPARPHVKLARVIATSDYGDEDDLDAKILESARRLGADAFIMGKMDVLEGPNTSQGYMSTNAPDVQSSLFGGLGSGVPFFFDPWTYVQGADRVDYLNYKSGLAIRYLPGTAAGRP